MKIQHSFAAILLASPALLANPAQAQIASDIEGAVIQQGQITDLLRDEGATGQILPGDNGEIAGEAGVYVLKLNEIFFVGASGGFGYAENPERTALNTSDSFYANAGVTAGVQTRLGETVDFGLRANVSGVEYFETNAPSSRSVVSSMAMGVPIGGTPLYASVNLFGGYNFDGDFEGGTGFYGASLAVNAGFPLGQRTLFRPGAGVTRQWSSISENNATTASVSATLLHQPAAQVTLGVEAQLGRVWFDNFYEDVIFVERRDWSYSGSVNADWTPVSWLSFGASAGYERRDSSFVISRYNGFEAAVSATVRHRF